jgi:hypothetical protein
MPYIFGEIRWKVGTLVRSQKGDSPHGLDADSLRIVSITDLVDQPLEKSKKFAPFDLSLTHPFSGDEKFFKIIAADFKDALEYLFPR